MNKSVSLFKKKKLLNISVKIIILIIIHNVLYINFLNICALFERHQT